MAIHRKKPALKIDVLTLFPEMFEGPLTTSLIGRAQKANNADIKVHDLRQWSDDKRHNKVDDRPYGGGSGMVIRPEPIYRAFKALGLIGKRTSKPWVIYLTPKGDKFTQKAAMTLSKKKKLLFLCGHYEGIDERVMKWVNQEISIGDYVLTGGEIPAMAVIDTLVRLIPGVVGDPESLIEESFSSRYLEYPHYTRPSHWRGKKVPDVLLSGNHQKIREWRKKEAVAATKARRPDLLEK